MATTGGATDVAVTDSTTVEATDATTDTGSTSTAESTDVTTTVDTQTSTVVDTTVATTTTVDTSTEPGTTSSTVSTTTGSTETGTETTDRTGGSGGVLSSQSHPFVARPADLETGAAAATIWLRRMLPDPTPPARRLNAAFSRELVGVARHHRVGWAQILAVVRARGHQGRVPATRSELVAVARRLATLHAAADPWQAFLAMSSSTSFADRALALVRYDRAVGVRALVTGLDAAKRRLERLVLRDRRFAIYPGGRLDIADGRVDVRILVLLRYLAEAHGEVTVSSLVSGHRLYARPGVISAHVYGLAVDITALGGVPIAGHQQPGGLTERAVTEILLLPRELLPQQVISLLGLGGPSFPLADHADHIHVGY